MKNLFTEVAKDVILIPVIPKLLENKDYSPQAMGIFYNYSIGNILPAREFRKALKYCFDWTNYKINKTIDTLESLGLIQDIRKCGCEDCLSYPYIDIETEKIYIHGFELHELETGNKDWSYDGNRITNLKIAGDYFFKMVAELDDLSMKMLIFLMMNDDFNRNCLDRLYRLSVRGKSGLLAGLGYSNNNNTANRVKERLESLKKKGYIDYSASKPSYTRFGHSANGSYMELTSIYRYDENARVNMKIPVDMYEELKKIVEEHEGKSE